VYGIRAFSGQALVTDVQVSRVMVFTGLDSSQAFLSSTPFMNSALYDPLALVIKRILRLSLACLRSFWWPTVYSFWNKFILPQHVFSSNTYLYRWCTLRSMHLVETPFGEFSEKLMNRQHFLLWEKAIVERSRSPLHLGIEPNTTKSVVYMYDWHLSIAAKQPVVRSGES
jgi:hypothetical protein